MSSFVESPVLGVGLVAFGLSGRVFHAPFIVTHPRFRLIAAYERSKNEAEAFMSKIGRDIIVYRDAESLVQRNDIDVVVICSPIEFHFEHAKLAILNKKHVLVEKAFTSNAAQAEELLRLAEENGVICTCYQNRRYDSDFRTLQRIINNDQLGEIVEYNGYFNRWSPAIRGTWKDMVAGSGGNFLSLGSHMLDQALCLFGTPQKIWADIRCQREGGVLDDAWEVHLFYNTRSTGEDGTHLGGFRAILKGSLLCRNHRLRYHVHGRKGSWIKHGVDPQEVNLMHGVMPDHSAASAATVTSAHDPLHYGEEASSQWGVLTDDNGDHVTPPEYGSYHLIYDGIYDAIVSGAAPPATPTQIITLIKLLDLAKESSRLGKTLDVNL